MLDLQNIFDIEDIYTGLGFYPSLESFRYDNTPCDVIIFGHFGIDGVHCGYLTDFGTVVNLEQAPIVCVSPMDERPIRMVAKNFSDFLSINMTDQALFYNEFDSEEDYLSTLERWNSENDEDYYGLSEQEKEVQEKIKNFLKENFEIPAIDHPYQYMKNLERERERSVTIQTQDKLGVTFPLRDGEKHISFPISNDTDPDLKLLKEYLYSAPIASRLAVIRDIQLNCILPYNEKINQLVINALKDMGFTDEAKRLASMEY